MKYLNTKKLLSGTRLIIILSILLLASTGWLACKTKPAPKAYKKLLSLPYNQPLLLKVPTYDGSNQAVHPDILYLGSKAKKNNAFALAMTPYPNGNDKLENPSLLLSKDGVSWFEPIKKLNPLAPAPPYDHNNDADLVYNPETGKYYIHYLESCRPDSQNIVRLTSGNLLSWQQDTAIHYPLSDASVFSLSPAMIRRSSNDWYMYYVNGRGRPNRIEYIRSEDGLLWDRKAVNMPKIDNDPGFVPWHVDVFESGKIYYMLVCGMVESPNLYLATSTDLVNWTYKTKPIILPGKQTLDSTRIYRSTGLVLGKDLWVWFSYTNAKKAWGMGLVRLNLENL